MSQLSVKDHLEGILSDFEGRAGREHFEAGGLAVGTALSLLGIMSGTTGQWHLTDTG